MLYLLDANVLIAAKNLYYPLDSVPEFWEWLLHHAELGNIKMPLEIVEEVKAGKPSKKKVDLLYDWISDRDHSSALILDEEAKPEIVDKVVTIGYAENLTDDELETIGRDPFLIAHAMTATDRCVVTTEASKPTKTRQNRRIPDVCDTFGVQCCNPFELNRALGFKTTWKK